jgi:hypothetical protein
MKFLLQKKIGSRFIVGAVWLGIAIYWIHWASYQPWKFSIFATAFETDAGRYAVPREVGLMKALAQRHPTGSYRLQEKFANQPLILQRATEFLYPLRIDDQALLIFAPLGIPLPDCRQIDAQSTVALYDCTP